MAGQEGEQVRQVLDQIFSGEGQTYEQFVNGFLFLRQEDVQRPPADEVDDLESGDGHVNGGTRHVNGGTGSSNGVNGINGYDHSDDDEALGNPPTQQSHSQSEDSLLEENLGPGTLAPSILMRTSETTGGTVVQLDNFVDDEGSPLSDLSPEDSGDDEESSYVFSGHPRESATHAGTELHLSPLASQTRTESGPTERSDSEPQSQASEDEVSAKMNTEEDGAKTDELEDVKPLPGEVDPDDVQDGMSATGATNVRHLSIKTTFRQCPDEQTEHTQPEDNETEYCEVEPFSIDEEFDYDNVVLTPKFNFMSSTMGANIK